MSQHQNNTNSEQGVGPWIKAVLFAIAVLVLLFFLITRSSCTRSEGSPSSPTTEEASGSEGSEKEASDEKPSEKEEDSPSEGESKSEDTTPESQGASESTPEKNVSETEGSTPGSAAPAKAPSTKSSKPDPGDDGAPAADSGSGGAEGQSIGGLFVKGEKLGVILDVSGSMSRYLESLRSEIRSRFDSPVFLEVEGCFIEPSLYDPAARTSPSSSNPYRRDSVMNAIRELVETEQVDSIYWFCDLQDERTTEGLEELEELVREAPGNSPGFHLYIRSTDRKPDATLDRIIRLSKGAFEKRR